MYLGRHPPGQTPPCVSQHALGQTSSLCIPVYIGADTPLPPDGHCSGWYASYWNAFLLSNIQSSTFSSTFPSKFSTYIYVDTLQNLNFDKKVLVIFVNVIRSTFC